MSLRRAVAGAIAGTIATAAMDLVWYVRYKPIWEYDAKTVCQDFSAHTVFSVTTAAVFGALAGSAARRRS
jgi:hypothetical protein